MGCCGDRRRELLGAPPANPARGAPAARSTRGAARATLTVRFEYVGRTGLTVRGPISGRVYRFGHRGAIVSVDVRDRLSLVRVPNLRQTTRSPS
jgi:hypothetical protein